MDKYSIWVKQHAISAATGGLHTSVDGTHAPVVLTDQSHPVEYSRYILALAAAHAAALEHHTHDGPHAKVFYGKPFFLNLRCDSSLIKRSILTPG
jgi:hypothetical protein